MLSFRHCVAADTIRAGNESPPRYVDTMQIFFEPPAKLARYYDNTAKIRKFTDQVWRCRESQSDLNSPVLNFSSLNSRASGEIACFYAVC
jgi:hypothetical protein